MRYVSSTLLRTPLKIGSRLQIANARSTRGSRRGDGDVFADLDQAIDCRICWPRLLWSDGEGLSLIGAGFRAALANGIELAWARLRLKSTVANQQILFSFPRRVQEREAFSGRFAVDAVGQINRERITSGAGTPLDSLFAPFLYGERVRDDTIYWDFFPWDRRNPVGCDQLAFTIRESSGTLPRFEARLMLVVTTEEVGDVYLELPPEELALEESTANGNGTMPS